MASSYRRWRAPRYALESTPPPLAHLALTMGIREPSSLAVAAPAGTSSPRTPLSQDSAAASLSAGRPLTLDPCARKATMTERGILEKYPQFEVLLFVLRHVLRRFTRGARAPNAIRAPGGIRSRRILGLADAAPDAQCFSLFGFHDLRRPVGPCPRLSPSWTISAVGALANGRNERATPI